MTILTNHFLWDWRIDDTEPTVLGAISLPQYFSKIRDDVDAKVELSERLADGKVQLENPLRAIAVRGGTLHQVVWLQTPPAFLIHAHILAAIATHELTGYNTFAVKFEIPLHGVVRAYSEKDYIGFGAAEGPPMDVDVLPIETRPAPVPNGRAFKVRAGFAVKANERDLPDVFRPQGTHFFVMSRRFKEVVEHFDIGNSEIQPTATFESRIWR